jgi:hypothetical protein
MTARVSRTAAVLGTAALCGGWWTLSNAEEPHAQGGHPSAPPATHPAPPATHPAPPATHPAPPAMHPAPQARPSIDGRGQVVDGRYNHGRYYAPVGTVARTLPADYRPYYHRGSPYYFSGGVWYAPRGPGFVVVTPPVGLVISVLPPYYSTVWIGGAPYYYADSVYYTAQPDQNGYVVASPPPDAGAPAPDDGDGGQSAGPPQSAPMDFIIYPKNGQSKDQQAADEYECHNWARGQSGFDPTQAEGGVPGGDVDRAHSNYDRAMSACLQGRGYQVN